MKIRTLIDEWAGMSPAAWSQNPYGWIVEIGEPITLADWQSHVLGEYWQRRQNVSTLFISTVKKAGKTLLNSLLTCHRWLTIPGVHFALGNDFDQGSMLQSDQIAEMVKRHPILKRYVKINRTEMIFLPTGSRLITLPADYAGSSGHNFLTVSFTEVWAFTYENHLRLYDELTPPPLVGALRVVDSYAGFEGESELLKRIWERGIAGERVNDAWPIYLVGQQLSYIHQGEDAQVACWRGTEAERAAYYQEQKATLRPNTYQRLHLNEWTAGDSNFVSLDDWQACIDPNHHPLAPGSVDSVYIGLDLALGPKGDDCALAAVYWDRESKKTKLAFHKVWKGKDRKAQLKLKQTVFPYLLNLKKQYRVRKLLYDPWQAASLTEDLQALGFWCVPVVQSHSERGEKDTFLYDSVINKRLVLYDHPDVRNLASQAMAKELPDGRIFLKKASGRSKIDLLIAISNCADQARGYSGWSR